jgi:hypothetical protein
LRGRGDPRDDGDRRDEHGTLGPEDRLDRRDLQAADLLSCGRPDAPGPLITLSPTRRAGTQSGV